VAGLITGFSDTPDISSYFGKKGLKPILIKFLVTAAVSACLHECQSAKGASIL